MLKSLAFLTLIACLITSPMIARAAGSEDPAVTAAAKKFYAQVLSDKIDPAFVSPQLLSLIKSQPSVAAQLRALGDPSWTFVDNTSGVSTYRLSWPQMRMLLKIQFEHGVVTMAGFVPDEAPAAALSNERDRQIVSGDITLYGSEVVPPSSAAVPIAIIVAGSGPTTRDGVHGDYRQLASALAAQGIATFRYDKRAIGQSKIAPDKMAAVRFDDYVNDLKQIVKTYKADPRFSRVIVIGHSEGSLIGIIAAADNPGIDRLVLLAGAGRDLGTVISEQMHAFDPAHAQAADAIISSLRAGKTVSNVDPALVPIFGRSIQRFAISEIRYNPADELRKVTIPVLIIRGGRDLQISEQDANLLKAADPKAQYVPITLMNHVLRDAPEDVAGNVATYSSDAPLSAPLVPAIVQFIKAPNQKTP